MERIFQDELDVLIEGEETVAAVDDVGEDDEAAKIDFLSVAVRGNVVLLAAVGADEEFEAIFCQFDKSGVLEIEDPFVNEIEIGVDFIG